MDLLSKKEIKNLLKKYQLKPSKRLGQNFLVDKRVLKKIIKTADLSPNDIVLEIGPGLGTLTIELAKLAKKVIAVEKDPNLVRILNEELRIKNIKNVEIIQGDILKMPNIQYPISNKISNAKHLNTKIEHLSIRNFIGNWELEIENYKVVANLPYYITSPAIRKFLETENKPKEMIFVIQKEVAQRIVARPPKMNLLAVSVQFYAQPKIISYISKKSFWPQPKVNSAILKIIPVLNKYTYDELFSKKFFKIVKAGFSQPRKQLANNLSKNLKVDKKKVESWLLKNKVKPSQRAETLSIKNWIDLTNSYKNLLTARINCLLALFCLVLY